MSQEYNVTPTKRPKHISRSQRNRPVLVTENSADEAQTLQETSPVESEAAPVEPPTTAAKARRKLPNFFSTIGKSNAESENDKPQVDPAQARLARATRTPKSVTQSTKAISKVTTPETAKETEKPVAKPAATPAKKPASAFKTKHIIGIAIYLLAANFVGLFETAGLNQLHANRNLTKFNLFGNPVTISTSTVVFLITLIVILVLLAKFDFIPRSLGPTPPARTGKTSSSNNTQTVKTPPPVIRPGVKGSDDKLYEEYRLNQRRDKKR
jgi:hypothetical protein